MGGKVIRLLRVCGGVQGVGYRAFARERAIRLGLCGWARNRSDGSVEILVGGDVSAVARLIDMLRRGPAGAHVSEVAESEPPSDMCSGLGDNFDILPTL